ncbi:MAG: ribosome biogenesis GTP-binding protein YihA/YsxC [Gammaproteobacteria bacterium]
MLDFRQTRFMLSAANATQFPPDQGREVAFAGRSNAGKSTALNAIAGQKALARISKSPGRTQLINFFSVDDVHRLVDLPGYGFAKVPDRVRQSWRQLLEGYVENRESLAGIVLLMDSRHPLKLFDFQMLDWTHELGLPMHILLSKIDKLKKQELRKTLQKVETALPDQCSVQAFSAKSGEGIGKARGLLTRWLSD